MQRVRSSGDISVSIVIHSNCFCQIILLSVERARDFERGIDDQRVAPVIAGEPERGALRFEQPVTTGNLDPFISNLLIYLGLELPEFRTAWQVQDQIA